MAEKKGGMMDKQQIITTKDKLENRIEPGALQINDDWKGYFFRGDDSMYLIMAIESLIQSVNDCKKLELHEALYIKNLECIIKDIKQNTLDRKEMTNEQN